MGDSSRPSPAAPPVRSTWARYVTGVDQAIERVRSEADARLLQEQQPPKAEEPPGTSLLEEDDGAGKKDAAAFVEEAALEAGRRERAERDLIDAIDLDDRRLETRNTSGDTLAAFHQHRPGNRKIIHTASRLRGTRQSPADGGVSMRTIPIIARSADQDWPSWRRSI